MFIKRSVSKLFVVRFSRNTNVILNLLLVQVVIEPAPGPKVERVNENISVRKLFVLSFNARTNVTVCCFYRWPTSPGPEVERAKRDHQCTKTVRGDPDT